ncbi:MAG: pyridoxal-phosphate dependent enzyme [Balneolaceae bacterium]
MSSTKGLPEIQDIREAARRIAPYAIRTPVFTSQQVNQRSEARVYFKCENFQRVGAFKFRGACNAVFSLSDKDASVGVATHSSGNHAQAVSLSARLRGIPAYIVMPDNAPKIKKQAVKNYGAEITYCEPTQKAREKTLNVILEKTGTVFIHPYDDSRIIAGQGTAAMELLEEVPDLDILLAPVGGGGLISGSVIAAKSMNSTITVIAAEPEEADDAYRSIKSGKRQEVHEPRTIADGLRTNLGSLPFEIIQQYLDDIVTVSEESIVREMRFIWERMNLIIEPSSAVPVSALFDGKLNTKGKKIGIILTGGNLDLDQLPWQS